MIEWIEADRVILIPRQGVSARELSEHLNNHPEQRGWTIKGKDE